MTLSYSHNEVKPKAQNVAQRSWESAPILKVNQPESVEDFKVAMNNPGCVTRAHPTAALSVTKLTRYVLASAHNRWPSPVTNCMKLVISCLYIGAQHERV